MAKNKVVHVLVEIRMTIELEDDKEDVVHRIEERAEEFEHDDTFNVDGGTPRSFMVHVIEQEGEEEVDEDASW